MSDGKLPLRPSASYNKLYNKISIISLDSCETSTMEFFCKNSQRPKDVNYFCKKAPPQMFDWIPNAPPIGKVL